MRIGVVSSPCNPTPPGDEYGGEIVQWDLAEGLAKKGHMVYLFAAEGSKIPTGGYLFTFPRAWKTHPEIRDAERGAITRYPHILERCEAILDWSVFHDTATWNWCRRNPMVCASTMWSGMSFDVPNPPYNVVFYSSLHARAAAARTIATRAIIPQPLDTDYYSFHPDKEDYFLFFGSLSPVKGASETIDAAKEANVRLLVCGDTKFADHAITAGPIIEKCKSMGVEFIDSPGRDQKRDLMQRALAIVSMQKEANAVLLTVLESMSCGTPAITLSVGAHGEDLPKQLAYICNDKAGIVESMKKVKENPNEIDKKLIRQWVKSNYCRDSIAERYLNLIEDIKVNGSW